jgi:hypothetical protein
MKKYLLDNKWNLIFMNIYGISLGVAFGLFVSFGFPYPYSRLCVFGVPLFCLVANIFLIRWTYKESLKEDAK